MVYSLGTIYSSSLASEVFKAVINIQKKVRIFSILSQSFISPFIIEQGTFQHFLFQKYKILSYYHWRPIINSLCFPSKMQSHLYKKAFHTALQNLQATV